MTRRKGKGRIAIVIEKIEKNHIPHAKANLQRNLRALGYDFHIWTIETKHRWEDFKEEFKKTKVRI